MCPSTALFMVSKVVAKCLRVQQNVNTTFSARCVFSSCWMEAGHGTADVMGDEMLEARRERDGGAFDLGVRRGFVPPSWVLVGIVAVIEELLCSL